VRSMEDPLNMWAALLRSQGMTGKWGATGTAGPPNANVAIREFRSELFNNLGIVRLIAVSR